MFFQRKKVFAALVLLTIFALMACGNQNSPPMDGSVQDETALPVVSFDDTLAEAIGTKGPTQGSSVQPNVTQDSLANFAELGSSTVGFKNGWLLIMEFIEEDGIVSRAVCVYQLDPEGDVADEELFQQCVSVGEDTKIEVIQPPGYTFKLLIVMQDGGVYYRLIE